MCLALGKEALYGAGLAQAIHESFKAMRRVAPLFNKEMALHPELEVAELVGTLVSDIRT